MEKSRYNIFEGTNSRFHGQRKVGDIWKRRVLTIAASEDGFPVFRCLKEVKHKQNTRVGTVQITKTMEEECNVPLKDVNFQLEPSYLFPEVDLLVFRVRSVSFSFLLSVSEEKSALKFCSLLFKHSTYLLASPTLRVTCVSCFCPYERPGHGEEAVRWFAPLELAEVAFQGSLQPPPLPPLGALRSPLPLVCSSCLYASYSEFIKGLYGAVHEEEKKEDNEEEEESPSFLSREHLVASKGLASLLVDENVTNSL